MQKFFKEGEIVEERVRKKYPYAKKEDQIKRANHFLTFGNMIFLFLYSVPCLDFLCAGGTDHGVCRNHYRDCDGGYRGFSVLE